MLIGNEDPGEEAVATLLDSLTTNITLQILDWSARSAGAYSVNRYLFYLCMHVCVCVCVYMCVCVLVCVCVCVCVDMCLFQLTHSVEQ